MANINNSQLSKELIDGAKIQTSFDRIPTQLADKVVPVMEVNPKMLRRINVVKRSSTAGTIYTTPTDKDFYLIAYSLNATSTAAGSNIFSLSVVPEEEGVATIIGAVYLYNTAAIDADSGLQSLSFPIAIKLKRGSTVVTASSGTTAARSCTIFGYTTEQG